MHILLMTCRMVGLRDGRSRAGKDCDLGGTADRVVKDTHLPLQHHPQHQMEEMAAELQDTRKGLGWSGLAASAQVQFKI